MLVKVFKLSLAWRGLGRAVLANKEGEGGTLSTLEGCEIIVTELVSKLGLEGSKGLEEELLFSSISISEITPLTSLWLEIKLSQDILWEGSPLFLLLLAFGENDPFRFLAVHGEAEFGMLSLVSGFTECSDAVEELDDMLSESWVAGI